ncbi:MAG: hypothetical protein CMN78_02705 [Spirochaetales bacterium]|nr:hypothetical protein [Spirochaetales bacterium]
MKIGIADYGLRMWFGGGEEFDLEFTLAGLKELGYEGIERCRATDAADLVRAAGIFRRLQMDFATVTGPEPENSINWTAITGRQYVWTMGKPRDFDGCCRMANYQAKLTAKWGIKTALHNHLGTPIESQNELERFLEFCPDVGLILDTAHLAAAEGDPLEVIKNYPDRLTAIHIKDWLVVDESISIKESWPKRGRFCALGEGNVDLDNGAVVRALLEVGYDGWIFVEQDTHLQDPMIDLDANRRYLNNAGI